MKRIFTFALIFQCFLAFSQKISKNQVERLKFNRQTIVLPVDTIETIRIDKDCASAIRSGDDAELKNVLIKITNLERKLDGNKEALIVAMNKSTTQISTLYPLVFSYLSPMKTVLPTDVYAAYSQEDSIYLSLRQGWKEKRPLPAYAIQPPVDSLSLAQATTKDRLRGKIWHAYLTIFYDSELNFAQQQLVTFIDKYMSMSEVENIIEGNSQTCKYQEMVSSGTPQTMTITYTLRMSGKNYIIDKVNIEGSREKVVKLFVNYWPTQIQSKEVKNNEWAYCYLAPDRIGLFALANGKAKIVIDKM